MLSEFTANRLNRTTFIIRIFPHTTKLESWTELLWAVNVRASEPLIIAIASALARSTQQ